MVCTSAHLYILPGNIPVNLYIQSSTSVTSISLVAKDFADGADWQLNRRDPESVSRFVPPRRAKRARFVMWRPPVNSALCSLNLPVLPGNNPDRNHPNPAGGGGSLRTTRGVSGARSDRQVEPPRRQSPPLRALNHHQHATPCRRRRRGILHSTATCWLSTTPLYCWLIRILNQLFYISTPVASLRDPFQRFINAGCSRALPFGA